MELRLQAEDSFVLKVVQLEELLQVRHSVFVIGNAGSGKSQVCPCGLQGHSQHSRGGLGPRVRDPASYLVVSWPQRQGACARKEEGTVPALVPEDLPLPADSSHPPPAAPPPPRQGGG